MRFLRLKILFTWLSWATFSISLNGGGQAPGLLPGLVERTTLHMKCWPVSFTICLPSFKVKCLVRVWCHEHLYLLWNLAVFPDLLWVTIKEKLFKMLNIFIISCNRVRTMYEFTSRMAGKDNSTNDVQNQGEFVVQPTVEICSLFKKRCKVWNNFFFVFFFAGKSKFRRTAAGGNLRN